MNWLRRGTMAYRIDPPRKKAVIVRKMLPVPLAQPMIGPAMSPTPMTRAST
jgi:hypothetical protein